MPPFMAAAFVAAMGGARECSANRITMRKWCSNGLVRSVCQASSATVRSARLAKGIFCTAIRLRWRCLSKSSGSFLPKFRIQRHETYNQKTRDRRQHHPHEEMLVSNNVLQPAAEHAGQHHSQGHKTGADRVVRRLVLSSSDVNHVEHVRG